MGEEVENLKKEIIHIFPKLEHDSKFKITSPHNIDYNCIAWAYQYSDRWMQPGGVQEKTLDGFRFWPDGIEDSIDIDTYIKAFRLIGYEICDNWEFEKGFQKIALYILDGNCTHASRQLRSSMWSSKLGQGNDIQHGSPYTIENDIYGTVHCIMKRPFL